jgi:hypothetical protein
MVNKKGYYQLDCIEEGDYLIGDSMKASADSGTGAGFTLSPMKRVC